MRHREAVILAGGRGTRLRPVVTDIPKPLVTVGNRPFLEFILDHLVEQGFTRVILAVGYRYRQIMDSFGNTYHGIPLLYSVESSPLGTGGAVAQALEQVTGSQFTVLNGDTLFRADLRQLHTLHLRHPADATLALKKTGSRIRYGSVSLNQNHRIVSFQEKQQEEEGLINGGIYIFNRDFFDDVSHAPAFSLEEDILQKLTPSASFYGFEMPGLFIDIGIPEDLRHARRLWTENQLG